MAETKIKQNVGIAKAVVILAAVANEAHRLNLPAEVVITSVSGGWHSKNSRHYFGQAVDVRSKNFPHTAKRVFLQRVLTRLGEGYTGLLEGEGSPNEHFHIQWSGGPRKRPLTEEVE